MIDKEFPSRDAKSIEALYMSGKAGAILHEGTALVLKARAVGFEFAGAPYPKKDADSEIYWRYKNNLCRSNYGVITTKCKHPNDITELLGLERTNYLMRPELFRTIYVGSGNMARGWLGKHNIFRSYNKY